MKKKYILLLVQQVSWWFLVKYFQDKNWNVILLSSMQIRINMNLNLKKINLMNKKIFQRLFSFNSLCL